MTDRSAKRVLLLGATGTIGRATAGALMARGHAVTCLVRAGASRARLTGARIHVGDVTRPATLAEVFQAGPFDAVVSCLASRTGVPQEAWAIDHKAHCDVLAAAEAAGTGQMVLLSAICVQKPRLAFQHAKRAFEAELASSGLSYSIVRPTAYFKSLSGQVARVQAGKPYLLFGDGRGTACKPLSDADLGAYMADCLTDPARCNRILPIGGPGPALTPREMGGMLFEMTGQPPRFRSVPAGLLRWIAGGLGLAGSLSPRLAAKAELARIGHYYATESMLVLDPATGRYDADATPETGTDTLADHYARLLRGEAADDRGAHAVF